MGTAGAPDSDYFLLFDARFKGAHPLVHIKKISLLFSASSERWPRRGRSNDANVCNNMRGQEQGVGDGGHSLQLEEDVEGCVECLSERVREKTLAQSSHSRRNKNFFAGELGPGHI